MKSPRSFTLKDTQLFGHYSAKARRALFENNSNFIRVAPTLAQLNIINSLNDMVVSLAGFEHCQYLPGDMIACKLNLVKMKRPRRNPWYSKLSKLPAFRPRAVKGQQRI